MNKHRDAHYMGLALAEAQRAAREGEVPVGAVVVSPGRAGEPDRILARAHNRPIGLRDPTAHAEMLALRAAAAATGNYRLDGCELFVTLEPCAMCAQAMLHARLARVVYGAREPKTGAAGSVIDVLGNPVLNHHTAVSGGVESEACGTLMQAFFAAQRRKAREAAIPLREDALRTPDALFEPLWQAWPDWLAHNRWIREGTALQGLRLHWMELSPTPASALPSGVVFLHGLHGWWPEWAQDARKAQAEGKRAFLPDLIGFGMSDKPKKTRWHTLARHLQVLQEWITALELPNWLVVAPPEQSRLAHALCARLGDARAHLEIRTPTPMPGLPEGWPDWPYPDAGHRAAQKAWPWPDA